MGSKGDEWPVIDGPARSPGVPAVFRESQTGGGSRGVGVTTILSRPTFSWFMFGAGNNKLLRNNDSGPPPPPHTHTHCRKVYYLRIAEYVMSDLELQSSDLQPCRLFREGFHGDRLSTSSGWITFVKV